MGNSGKQAFLKDAMRNSQRTFNPILWIIVAAFATGIALVVGAFLGATLGDDTTQKSVISGISGGGG